MNSALNNLVIYNGYPLSVVAAVTLHLFLMLGLIYFQTNSNIDSLDLIQPTVIKALFIDENPQVRNERNLERQRVERLDQQRVAREDEQSRLDAEQQRQAEAERERQLEQQQQEERSQVEQRRLDQERRQQEADQQRQRELNEAERIRQVEAQRLREMQEAERLRQDEASTAASAQAARNEFELVQSATALIQQAVQQVWNRPPSARNGMRAILQIRMLPTGELLDASIRESSGDPAFDLSAENAAYSAAPFTELQSLPINVFNANFRTLSLIFQPEDLLN